MTSIRESFSKSMNSLQVGSAGLLGSAMLPLDPVLGEAELSKGFHKITISIFYQLGAGTIQPFFKGLRRQSESLKGSGANPRKICCDHALQFSYECHQCPIFIETPRKGGIIKFYNYCKNYQWSTIYLQMHGIWHWKTGRKYWMFL